MGKYDHLKILKRIKARSNQVCYNCSKEIYTGENYYQEHIEDKFLHSLHAKKYCSSCYEKYGDMLLSFKEKTSNKYRSLEEFDNEKRKIQLSLKL